MLAVSIGDTAWQHVSRNMLGSNFRSHHDQGHITPGKHPLAY